MNLRTPEACSGQRRGALAILSTARRNSFGKLRSHQFTALEVPLEGGQDLPASFFVKLNLSWSHRGSGWKSCAEPRPRESLWPCRN
jgi:hypothetical protein